MISVRSLTDADPEVAGADAIAAAKSEVWIALPVAGSPMKLADRS